MDFLIISHTRQTLTLTLTSFPTPSSLPGLLLFVHSSVQFLGVPDRPGNRTKWAYVGGYISLQEIEVWQSLHSFNKIFVKENNVNCAKGSSTKKKYIAPPFAAIYLYKKKTPTVVMITISGRCKGRPRRSPSMHTINKIHRYTWIRTEVRKQRGNQHDVHKSGLCWWCLRYGTPFIGQC